MLEAGDRIEFYSITPEEYKELKEKEEGAGHNENPR